MSAIASGLPSLSATRRNSLGRLMDSSTMLLLCTIGGLIIVLALLILFHHNMNATKGYKLRSLEYARSQLLLEQEVLNMRIAKAQALATLQKDPRVQAMMKPVKPKYLEVETSVAANEMSVN